MSTPTAELRMIRRQEVPQDVPLPGGLRDHTGRVLIPRGQVFDQAEQNRLGSRVLYVGDDWPSFNEDHLEDTPDEVVDALADQWGQAPIEKDDRRAHIRHRWEVPLKVQIKEATQGSRVRAIQVTTLEISAGGFSFMHSHFLYPDTLVMARFDVLPHKPTLLGIVRSCIVKDSGTYRIGVQFQEYCQSQRQAMTAIEKNLVRKN